MASNCFAVDPPLLYWLVLLLIWFLWCKPESDWGVIQSTVELYNKKSSDVYPHSPPRCNTWALEIQLSLWPHREIDLHLLCCCQPAHKAPAERQREDISSTAAFVVNSLSKTTCSESQPPTLISKVPVYKHMRIPQMLMNALNLPIWVPEEARWQRGERVEGMKGGWWWGGRGGGRSRSEMQKVKVSGAFN